MKKILIIALALSFFVAIVNAANNIDNITFTKQNGVVIFKISGIDKPNYEFYPLNDISLMLIKDATIASLKIQGDDSIFKTVDFFQISSDPVQTVGAILLHDKSIVLQRHNTNILITHGKDNYPDQPENVDVLSKERYRYKLFEIAEELFAVEKYDEATILYNSIYADEFYVPLSIVNMVRLELNMDPVKPDIIVLKDEKPEETIAEEIIEQPIVEEIVIEPEFVILEEPEPVIVEEVVIEPEPVIVEEPAPVIVEEVVIEPEPVIVEEPAPVIVEEVVIEPELVIVEEPAPVIVEEVVIEPEPVIVEEPAPVIVEEVVIEPEPVIVEEPALNLIERIDIITQKDITRLQIVSQSKILYEFTKNEKAASIEIRLLNSEFKGNLPNRDGLINALSGNQFRDRYVLNLAYEKDADVSIFPIDKIIECSILRPTAPLEAKKRYVEFEATEKDRKTLEARTLVEERQYRGMSRISLNLNNASLTSFLRLISIEKNVNIYSDPGVTTRISINVSNQPWEPTLDVILKNYNLTYEWESNNTIRVTNFDRLKKEKEELKKSLEAKESVLPLLTRIYPLSFTKANTLQTFLKQPIISPRGSVDFNVRNNILIVRDIEEKLNQIDKLIQEIDEETRQVNILVRIYRLNDVTTKNIGINWGLDNLNQPGDVDIRTGVNLGPTNFRPGDNYGMISLLTQNQMSRLSMTLSALIGKNKVSLETFPNITTLNHQTADIVIGQKIPITMLDDAGNTVTQLTTVGTKIKVTPHINADGRIILNINPEISNLAGVVGGLINIATSEAKTTMIVNNGDTAVIGGLVEYRVTNTKGFIPFLGKIPIIGLLFKNSATTTNRGEIIIFVTPQIIE